jgi:hypothetical protein
MFNKNGQKLLNTNYSELTYNQNQNKIRYIKLAAITSSNKLIDVNGVDVTTAYAFYAADANAYTVDQYTQGICKYLLVGYQGNFINGNTSPSANNIALSCIYNVGFRSGGFTENTFAPVGQANAYTSMSQSQGIKTFTITNSSDSDITINEISFCAYVQKEQSVSSYAKILFAGFNLGEITIPAGGAYSFTLTHLMESET